jgi:dTDP-4-dehydrorhamnose reductase
VSAKGSANTPAKVLVIGRTGQLARELAVAPRGREMALEFIGRETLDLSQPGDAAEAVRRRAPDLVLLVAAYTAVDKAEADEATARRGQRRSSRSRRARLR